MSSTKEYDHFIFPHKFSSDDYLFIYAAGDNNVVSLIYPNPDIEDTPEAYITYEDAVDTMGDDILEVMECKNGNLCDDSDPIFGEEHEMD